MLKIENTITQSIPIFFNSRKILLIQNYCVTGCDNYFTRQEDLGTCHEDAENIHTDTLVASIVAAGDGNAGSDCQ